MKSAFTLVELIVVITILAILGTIAFVSFQGFSVSARDSKRVNDVKVIEKGLSFYETKNSTLPLPDNIITITASGTTLSYQGYAGSGLLSEIRQAGNIVDPILNTPYLYMVNSGRTKFQLLSYMERAELSLGGGILESYANTLSYSDMFPRVFSSSLGILTQTDNTPPMELTIPPSTIDILNTGGTEYISYISQEKQIQGDDTVLASNLVDTYPQITNFINTSVTIPGLNLWLDASDHSTITDVSGFISEWADKSSSNNTVTQLISEKRPQTAISMLNNLNTIHFDNDFLDLSTSGNYRTLIFVVQNANGSSHQAVSSIVGEGINPGSYIFLRSNVSDGAYDISIDGNIGDIGTVYYGGGIGASGTNINLGLTNSQVKSSGIWIVIQDTDTSFDYIGRLVTSTIYDAKMDLAEIISYDRVLDSGEINTIGTYLGEKWNVSWTDI